MSAGADSAGAGGRCAAGWRAAEVEEELPGLRLLVGDALHARPQALTGDSPPEVRERLRELSNRFRGARAVGIRREPVPAAYRVFFRQIGLDPDVVRTPIEAAVMERMLRGGFLGSSLLADVLLIALLDTCVPVWALDSESLDGELGIRASGDGEPLGRAADAPALPAGRLVVADSSAALAVLFGELAPGHQPRTGSTRVTLFAVQVEGVPTLYAEESLWACRAALSSHERPATAPASPGALVESASCRRGGGCDQLRAATHRSQRAGSGADRRSRSRPCRLAAREPHPTGINARRGRACREGFAAGTDRASQRERSAIVAERFPHIPAPVASGREVRTGGPTLLDLGELERVRDALAADIQELHARVDERVERERRAREQLQQMQLDPGSYKFARLPVRDLGQGVCGVWEVRPRLGLIGMLAGWWQLKLSSGCPLARGSRSTRDPGSQR